MKIRIPTRKSKLALAQARLVADEIIKNFPNAQVELVKISTTGDLILHKPLTAIGGKGVFVSEIERALLDGQIDLAVHSAKDLPLRLEKGLGISSVLKRGNYRDILITQKSEQIKNEPDFVVGTGSLRRRLSLKKLYPNVSFGDIRGNVDTRLEKLSRGEYDAIVLAAAGLERLGLDSNEKFDYTYFDYTEFLPAPCQGIIAVESRENDFAAEVARKINDKNTFLCFETEREVLRLLDADCGMPVGAFSFVEDGQISLSVSKDGVKNIVGSAEILNRFELVKGLVSQL
jgi:hydroxymethylbilane synthase